MNMTTKQNPYQGKSLGELSKFVGAFHRGEVPRSEHTRFDSMDLCEALMEHADATRDPTLHQTICRWVGRVQAAAGTQ